VTGREPVPPRHARWYPANADDPPKPGAGHAGTRRRHLKATRHASAKTTTTPTARTPPLSRVLTVRFVVVRLIHHFCSNGQGTAHHDHRRHRCVYRANARSVPAAQADSGQRAGRRIPAAVTVAA